MFDAIKQKCQDYYDQIPSDTFQTVGKSALYSFTVSLIYVRRDLIYSLERPLFSAGITALAALIYALATPLFNSIFGDNDILYHREFIKNMVVSVSTSILVTYMTQAKVDIMAMTWLPIISCNALKASCDLPINILNWMGEHQAANYFKNLTVWLGVNTIPGAGSVCFTF